ncbi:MAG: glycosyltransferase family 2 protein [Bacteroidota bacterium]
MVYIVIPCFNRKKLTRGCLQALENQTYKDFKVIVVDDGSTDGTANMITREFPETILLFGDGNLFWTGATNKGVRYALENGATHVMALNDDTVPKEDYMEKMMYWAEQKPNAILGALDYDYNSKKPYFGGEIHNWKTNKSFQLLDRLPPAQHQGLHKVTHAPGRGLLIPRKIFETIGLFEEKKLPQYAADYDFTFQAAKAGFEIYCNYDAMLYSFPQESGDHQKRMERSWSNYKKHLFSITGTGNLKVYTHYVLRNCPPVYVPYALFDGYARRILGYWLKGYKDLSKVQEDEKVKRKEMETEIAEFLKG